MFRPRCLAALTIIVALAGAAAHAQTDAPADILVSRQLAESERLSVGDVVRLATTADGSNARQFRIAGIYEPTPDPQRLGAVPREVRLHQPDLLDMLRHPEPSVGTAPMDGIYVLLIDRIDAATFDRDLNARLPGVCVRRADLTGTALGTFTVVMSIHSATTAVTIL